MNKIMKWMKAVSVNYDFINALLGIALIVLLILVYRYPQNSLLLLITFVTGGFMNIVMGLKYKKDSKRKNMAMSYILFGIMLIFIGYLVVVTK